MWRCLVGCWGYVGNGWTGLRVVNVPGWGRADVCINMGLCTDGVDEMLKSVFITLVCGGNLITGKFRRDDIV